MHTCEVKALSLTFRGGVRIDGYRRTKKCRVEKLPDVDTVSISMDQLAASPATPIVSEGEYVKLGQKIGEAGDDIGAPVHSSVSGFVKKITPEMSDDGYEYSTVTIENDKKYVLADSVKPYTGILAETSGDAIIEIVKEAGIAGLDGDARPAHLKLRDAMGKTDKLIINCLEKDPFSTTNYRLLLEDPASVINGTKIILKAIGVRSAVLAVEDSMLDAVNNLETMLSSGKMIKVRVVKSKYPQHNDAQLIYALTGRTLPFEKKPTDIGYALFGCTTASAIFQAFSTGMPLVNRRITVDGDCVKRPKNLLVPIGAGYSDIVEFCGGLSRVPEKLISGGVMTGDAETDPCGAVTKRTESLILLSEKMRKRSSMPPACIRCGECVKVCPVRLMPNYIAAYADIMELKRAEELGANECIECGLCSYVCPNLCEVTEKIKSVKKYIASDREYKSSESSNEEL